MSIGLFQLRPYGPEKSITSFKLKKTFGVLPIRFFDNKGELLNSQDGQFVMHPIPAETAIMVMFARSIATIQTQVSRKAFGFKSTQGTSFPYDVAVEREGVVANGCVYSNEEVSVLPFPPIWEAMMGIEAILFARGRFDNDANIVELMKQRGLIS